MSNTQYLLPIYTETGLVPFSEKRPARINVDLMKIRIPLLLLGLLVSQLIYAQYLPASPDFFGPYRQEELRAKLHQRNFGAILGVQRGKYTFFEFGAEHHWRTISLTNPRIYALGANAAYNFGHNSMAYNAFFWHKRGRVNLTYGLNLIYLTNFENDRFGGGPMVGFRLLGFHLNTGYNFLTKDKTIEQEEVAKANPMYISLRYYFPVDNKFKWAKKKKDGDNDNNDKEKERKKAQKKRKNAARRKRKGKIPKQEDYQR